MNTVPFVLVFQGFEHLFCSEIECIDEHRFLGKTCIPAPSHAPYPIRKFESAHVLSTALFEIFHDIQSTISLEFGYIFFNACSIIMLPSVLW